MTPIVKIAAFMKKRIKALKYMHREDLLYWLMWHDKHGSLAFHVEQGKIAAAGVARPIANIMDRIDYYEFNEGADTVYADQACSTDSKSFATLIQTMANRFSYAKTFMYKNKKTGVLKTWNLQRFLHITNKKAQL